MRPVELVVSGLHSFREKQVIDFQTLREAGVFGIFGPTGSGKSSLLDAMTLALYGKVERATNNTQGILNHAEDTLTVSFTFELGKGRNSSRYRVERMYKRSSDISVRTSHSRFVEIGDKETVLADRERDVTAKVQGLLGLTSEDFTRAVVLPQGKFAEFLSLKGVERRKMLERLFHLEKYGEKLNRRLKARLESAKADVNKIEALQLELGQASKDDVKQKEDDLRLATTHLKEKRRALEKAEKIFQEQQQIWQWQQEKQQLEEKQAALEKQKSEMAELKQHLYAAEEADRLKPYLDDYKNAEKAALESEEQLLKVQALFTKTSQRFAQTKRDYETKKQQREEHTPALIRRIEQYKQAEKLEEQWMKTKAEADKKKAERDQLIEKIATLKKNSNETRELLERATACQEKLKAELEACSVPFAEREQIQHAARDKQKIAQLLESKQEVDKERVEKQHRYEKRRSAYEQLTNERENLEEKGVELFQQVERLYHDTKQLQTLFAKHENRLTEAKERLESDLEESKRHELARALAAELHAGQACPVCGSYSHPDPIAKHVGTDKVDHSKAQMDNVRTDLENISRSRYELDRFELNLKQLSESLMERIQIHPQVNELRSTPIKTEGLSLSEIGNRLILEMKSLQQDIIATEEKVKGFVKQSEQCERKQFEAKSHLHHAKEAITSLHEKAETLTNRYQTAIEEWKKTYQGRSFAQVEQEQEEIAKKDRTASDLNARIKKSIPYIEEKRKALDRLTQTLNEEQLKKENVDATWQLAQKEAKALKAELDGIVHEQSPSELLQQTKQELERLKDEENASYNRYHQCYTEKQSLEKQVSKAEEMTVQLNKQKEATNTKWQQLLRESVFDSAEALEQALTNAEKQKEWTRKLEQFAESERAVKHDLKRLNHLLGNQQLTEEEWLQTKETLSACKEACEEAKERKSKAEFSYHDVKKRHERYMELEAEGKTKKKLVERLEDLERVLRGNAFVEFLAEEQLMHVTRDASIRLGKLTRQRYAIEVNSEGGFVIRDDANAGVKRPVSTLSGGETFLTSLALALSLSSQIQLRGKYPLEFFFLDEGFGTLDQDLLETVITGLEKLHMDSLSVGVISHVPELQARLPRKLIVHPAEASGRGSRVTLSL